MKGVASALLMMGFLAACQSIGRDVALTPVSYGEDRSFSFYWEGEGHGGGLVEEQMYEGRERGAYLSGSTNSGLSCKGFFNSRIVWALKCGDLPTVQGTFQDVVGTMRSPGDGVKKIYGEVGCGRDIRGHRVIIWHGSQDLELLYDFCSK